MGAIHGHASVLIEPQLIARTIVDSFDEFGEIALSRLDLARMIADFDSISDEELDVLCAV